MCGVMCVWEEFCQISRQASRIVLGNSIEARCSSDFALDWSYQKAFVRQVVLDVLDAVFATMELGSN